MSESKHKPLKKTDIETLEKNGCSSRNWGRVLVSGGFDASKVMDVVFEGDVRIGALTGEIRTDDGILRCAGIYRANLQDVSIGDNCFISGVNGWLCRLEIGDGVLIENVGTIVCAGPASFGNGHEIAVFNEGGGRELKITTQTTAQIAYMNVMYRDKADLVGKLGAMADKVAGEASATVASIGDGAIVANCDWISNVRIGACAKVIGAKSLKNGTIDSSRETPSTVGNGVIAEEFICQKGSSVADGAMISSSLIGEGTRIGKQFSAENSIFMANSEGFHSEACSAFCGPYSVTHHRSTLLIGACVSFYNAGSGTNQSNHMYKLGPVHQGILERGCKTGSFSYLLWPSRVGAFTAIMGKHYANFDTSDFPFSYIDEDHGKSTLVPGMNFFTVGTLRDGEKWPSRDRRKGGEKLDLIVFDVLSPFTAQKMIRGRKTLMDLHENSDKGQEYVSCCGINIKRLLLKTCSRYYKLALDKYFGDVVVRKLETAAPSGIREILVPASGGVDGNSEWIDVFGLLCTRQRMDSLVSDVISGRIQTLVELQKALRAIYDSYRADEWNWVLANYGKTYGKELSEETDEGLAGFIDRWKDSSMKLLNMVLNDAQKEFEGAVRTGFGIDGNADSDFEAVRGTFDGNKFVRKLKADIESIGKRHENARKLAK